MKYAIFFFPKVLDATSSKNGLVILWYVLSKLLFVQKEMCMCKRERQRNRDRQTLDTGMEERKK